MLFIFFCFFYTFSYIFWTTEGAEDNFQFSMKDKPCKRREYCMLCLEFIFRQTLDDRWMIVFVHEFRLSWRA